MKTALQVMSLMVVGALVGIFFGWCFGQAPEKQERARAAELYLER